MPKGFHQPSRGPPSAQCLPHWVVRVKEGSCHGSPMPVFPRPLREAGPAKAEAIAIRSRCGPGPAELHVRLSAMSALARVCLPSRRRPPALRPPDPIQAEPQDVYCRSKMGAQEELVLAEGVGHPRSVACPLVGPGPEALLMFQKPRPLVHGGPRGSEGSAAYSSPRWNRGEAPQGAFGLGAPGGGPPDPLPSQ